MSDEALMDRLSAVFGMTLVPGTLNLKLPKSWSFPAPPNHLAASDIAADWEETTGQAGYWWCRALIGGSYAGVVAQADEPGYPADQVEIMAEVNLREAARLGDGDQLEFTVLPEP